MACVGVILISRMQEEEVGSCSKLIGNMDRCGVWANGIVLLELEIGPLELYRWSKVDDENDVWGVHAVVRGELDLEMMSVVGAQFWTVLIYFGEDL